MARLKKTQDERYIIVGPDYPGGVFSTRQICREGVEWLTKRGINVNDQVPIEYIRLLVDKGYVWTGGSGAVQQGSVAPVYSEDFLKELEKWSKQGSPDKLREILADSGNKISLNDCFAKKFISWVISLESCCAPHTHLCDLQFEEIIENFFNQNLPPIPELHLQLHERERGRLVLCHWMQWISEVWRIRNNNVQLPKEWRSSVYEVIYNLLTDTERISITLPWRKKLPYIRWQDDEIALVIPPQKGPKEGHLQFNLNDFRQNLSWQQQKNFCLSEQVVHFIREPEPPTHWELIYFYDGQEWGRITGAFPLDKILLFQENGAFLSPSNIVPLPPGRSYLLLFHEEARESVIKEGIELNEDRRQIEPVGWWDWEGYSIDIPVKQDKLGPYTFVPQSITLSFRLSFPCAHPVEFAHQVSVYLGDWPLIQVDHINTIINLDIIKEDDGIIFSKQLNISGTGRIDLTKKKKLSNRYGLFTIRVSYYSERGREHQEAQCLRLPDWELNYIDDPAGRPAKALLICGVKNGKLEASRNCQILQKKDDEFLITLASYPDISIAELIWQDPAQKEEVRFAVRLPVFRGAILEHGKQIPSWQEMPLATGGDFLSTTREGEIRLELLDPLPNGEVWIKSVGNRAVKIGESKGRIVRLPCHRLRDYLGGKFLALYLKTARGWEEFLNHSVVPPPPQPSSKSAKDDSFEKALWQADIAALEDFWQKAIEATDSINRIPYASIFLGTHLGHFEGLDDFLTNYPIEAKFIQLRRALRQPQLTYQQLESYRAQINELPSDSYQYFAEGEWWYRLARNHWTAAPGAYNEVSRLLGQGGWGDPVTTLEAYCICAMVALLIAKELPENPAREMKFNPYQLFFQECHKFLSASWQGDPPSRTIEFPKPLDILLAPQDVILLRTCQTLLQGDESQAGVYLDQALPYADTFKTVYTLLKARLFRLQGQWELSRSYYRQLLGALPFILDEINY